MATMFVQLALLLIFSTLVSWSHAKRADVNHVEDRIALDINEAEPGSVQVHPVHILLTRHGVSCANIVNDFAAAHHKGVMKHITAVTKFAHAFMKDPLLCHAGEHFANVSGREVPEALAKRGLPQPDAVLSSVLARAVHTAVVQFPNNRPVYVVPWIRESGMGADNDFNNRTTQLAALEAKIGKGAFSVDYHYPEVLGYGHNGDWDKFSSFLKDMFIPDLLKRVKKEPGEPIVLAVVTHSNFMNEDPIGGWCKATFLDGKARNNQVVDLPYTFTSTLQEAGSTDTTPTRTFERMDKPCESVVPGVSLRASLDSKEKVRLCRHDVGQHCWQQIVTQGAGTFPRFLEDDLEAKEQAIAQRMERAATAKASNHNELTIKQKLKLVEADIELFDGEMEAIRKTDCWTGGHPDPATKYTVSD